MKFAASSRPALFVRGWSSAYPLQQYMRTDRARGALQQAARQGRNEVTLHAPLLTAVQVAELLGGEFPPKTVLQLAREGRLPHLRIGRHVRFVRAEIEATLGEKRVV